MRSEFAKMRKHKLIIKGICQATVKYISGNKETNTTTLQYDRTDDSCLLIYLEIIDPSPKIKIKVEKNVK
jgi:hypothetical protein